MLFVGVFLLIYILDRANAGQSIKRPLSEIPDFNHPILFSSPWSYLSQYISPLATQSLKVGT